MSVLRAVWFGVMLLAASAAHAEDARLPRSELKARTFELSEKYFEQFQHPKTFVLYGAKLSTKETWTSPEEVKSRQPAPWGYGSRIADTALHCGHTLVALLDAYDAAPDPYLRRKAEELYSALKFIGGICPVEGLVPRGPHPDDHSAYYDDSSMDQHTTYIIALARYANSDLATAEDEQWIARKLGAVGRRLEGHDFSIKTADGVTQSHVGFSWKGFRNNHVSILIPTVYALYKGTGDQHWLKLHDQFLAERDGLRWQQLHAGDHVELNGHPIYANQNGFRLNAYLHFLEDKDKRAVISDLLAQSARMQLERNFPGPFYRKYHSEERWAELAHECRWGDSELRGAQAAWNLFRPEMLDDRSGLTALAHVRFPLGGYHLVLMSERAELIRRDLPTIWKMLTTVDLNKISAAETHYLFTTVALHAYAYCNRHPNVLAGSPDFGPLLTNTLDAGIGPTMDVTIGGARAYAIGNGTLHVLDIGKPSRPQLMGKLSGLGGVRQIVVEGGFAYITSREDGLFIVDVSDPAKPKLVSRYDTIEFATGICKSGDVLFVACRSFGVELIDVSAPTSPRHLSTVRTGEAQSVIERNGYLYAGVWGTSEVVTVDVRNPWMPRITSRTPLDGFCDGVDVRGNYLYAATGHHSRLRPRAKPGDPGFGHGHGLEVLEITEPSLPKPVTRVKFPALYNIRHDMWGVTIANGHAFVSDTHNGVFVLNVRDPLRPRFVGHWTAPRKDGEQLPGFVGGLIPGEDHIYVAGGDSDLHVLTAPDIARVPVAEDKIAATVPATRPTETDAPFRAYRTDGQIYGVDFLGDKAIVACGASGVHVLKINPHFETLWRIETTGRATDVCVTGDRIYVAEGSAGLGIYQLDSNAMNRIGRYGVPSNTIRQVEVPGDAKYAVVQVGVHKIQIVDVTNPAHPHKVLEDQHLGLLYGDQLMRGLIDDRYACAFWHVSGLHWYDLKADGGPRHTGDNFPGRIGSGNGLVAHADKTMATTRGGYLLLDCDERRDLSDVPMYRIGAQHQDLGKPTINGNRLYTVNRRTGLVTIADIADPRNPELVDQFELPGNPSRSIVHDGVLIIPDGYHGLLVFDR
jgi:hypothetical protein